MVHHYLPYWTSQFGPTKRLRCLFPDPEWSSRLPREGGWCHPESGGVVQGSSIWKPDATDIALDIFGELSPNLMDWRIHHLQVRISFRFHGQIIGISWFFMGRSSNLGPQIPEVAKVAREIIRWCSSAASFMAFWWRFVQYPPVNVCKKHGTSPFCRWENARNFDWASLQ